MGLAERWIELAAEEVKADCGGDQDTEHDCCTPSNKLAHRCLQPAPANRQNTPAQPATTPPGVGLIATPLVREPRHHRYAPAIAAAPTTHVPMPIDVARV